jgi:hypothetical protein
MLAFSDGRELFRKDLEPIANFQKRFKKHLGRKAAGSWIDRSVYE